jgi:hypothetical protein
MSKTKAKAFEKSNKGVELRSKKDIESLPSNPVNIQAKLEEKAKQYEALSKNYSKEELIRNSERRKG